MLYLLLNAVIVPYLCVLHIQNIIPNYSEGFPISHGSFLQGTLLRGISGETGTNHWWSS